jgi:hypothetical protein
MQCGPGLKENPMFSKIALISLAAALALPAAAFAQSPTGYGTEGPRGKQLHSQAQSTFSRGWNHFNESKYRAESSAAWLRQHGKSFPSPF